MSRALCTQCIIRRALTLRSRAYDILSMAPNLLPENDIDPIAVNKCQQDQAERNWSASENINFEYCINPDKTACGPLWTAATQILRVSIYLLTTIFLC